MANYAHVLIHKCIKFFRKPRAPRFSSGSQSHPPLENPRSAMRSSSSANSQFEISGRLLNVHRRRRKKQCRRTHDVWTGAEEHPGSAAGDNWCKARRAESEVERRLADGGHHLAGDRQRVWPQSLGHRWQLGLCLNLRNVAAAGRLVCVEHKLKLGFLLAETFDLTLQLLRLGFEILRLLENSTKTL